MGPTQQQTLVSPKVEKRIALRTLIENGESITSAALKVGVHRSTAKKWKYRHSVLDNPRTGRPTKMSPNSKNEVRKHMFKNLGSSVRKTAKVLNLSSDFQERGKSISHMTVQREVKSNDWGQRAYKVWTEPMKSKTNVGSRRNFIEKCEEEGYTDPGRKGQELRQNILWTDESIIELHPKPNKQNKRIRVSNPDDIPSVKLPNFGLKIMVAGGMTGQGLTDLHVVKKGFTVNGAYYREHILPIYLKAYEDGHLFRSRKKATFMHDGATAHTAKASEDMVTAKFPRLFGKGLWPGNSPDFNPIEHLWSELQESVFKEPRPTDRETLILRVEEKWKSLPMERFKKLAESFRTRLYEARDNPNTRTRY